MKLYRIFVLMIAFLMVGSISAQKRKTSKKSKSKTTKVVKKQEPVVAVPLDSIIGKAYMGKVGRTVVDFFGNRTTYGDVTQEIYLWKDDIYVMRQAGGTDEDYIFGKYSFDGTSLKLGEFTYKVLKNGNSLQLQKTIQKNEAREGTVSSVSPENIVNTIFVRGKYLDRPTIEDEEDKKNAYTCLAIAADYGLPEAKEYILGYHQKRVDQGNVESIRYLYNDALNKKDYRNATTLIDKLIALSPDNPEIQCDKGSLLLAQGKKNDAKKLWKTLRKKHASFANSSSHKFCASMRGK